MSKRILTTFFGTKRLGDYQRKHKVKLDELISFEDMDVNTLIGMTWIGNPQINTYDEAAEIIDRYIAADDSHSHITAYIDLIDEMDKDIHLFKGFGANVKQIKAEMLAKVAEVKAATEAKIEEYSDDKTDETPQPEDTVEAEN